MRPLSALSMLLPSEAVAQDDQCVRITTVLTQEIVDVATNQRDIQCRAPMLADSLRILALQPESITILADGAFERDTSIRVDRVTGAAENCFRKAAIRRKSRSAGAAPSRYISGVTANKEPLAGLPFELDDVQ